MVAFHCRSPLVLANCVLVALSGQLPCHAQSPYRASLATNGAEADWDSGPPAVSANGRYITFTSGAFNLVAGGTPDTSDVYVRDRVTPQTTCVSVATAGAR